MVRVILEGLDKSGKSYLADYLSKELDMKIVKFSQPKTEDTFNEYTEFFWTEKENKKAIKNDNVICDRSWIGECIYAPIYRKKTLKKFQIKRLDEACKVNWDIIIYCQTDKSEVKKRFISEKETFTQAKDVGRIQRNFVKVLKTLTTTVVLYDMNMNNMESIKNIILALKK